MKIKLTKDYILVSKLLPKGRVVEVSTELGGELIAKKVGKEVVLDTPEEIEMKTRFNDQDTD